MEVRVPGKAVPVWAPMMEQGCRHVLRSSSRDGPSNTLRGATGAGTTAAPTPPPHTQHGLLPDNEELGPPPGPAREDITAVLGSHRLVWLPGTCASLGSRAGSPWLCPENPSLNKGVGGVSLTRWRTGLHLCFNPLAPGLSPSLHPPSPGWQHRNVACRTGRAAAGGASERCIPGEGLAGQREGAPAPPHPATCP